MKKNYLAGMIALIICMLAVIPAMAEISARNTEENGKVTETVWLDDNGNPAMGPEGYARVRYTYKREETIEKYFDTDGQPCQVNGGYYGKRIMRDGRGNITEIEYLDAQGNRTLNRKGFALVGITYYGFGEVRTITYYGLNKKPVTVPSLGYASIYNEYSNKTMTARTFRDTKGNPVDCADGYAAVKQKVDKRFRVLSIRYDHANGKPATGPDGWFRCVKNRDDKGRITSIKYYDVNEQLTDRGAGYAWEEYSYEGDSIVKLTRRDLNNAVVTDSAGVATLVQEMKDGRVTKESFLDSEGKRINNKQGVGAVLYSYDAQGGLEKVLYQDTEGNPALCSGGYAGYIDAKDGDGTTISRTLLGTDGKAAEISGGYSEIRYFYNAYKQLSSTRYYDLNGQQVQVQ
jgi:hypothetical protein